MAMRTSAKCGKTISDGWYHCEGCHESFAGLTAFDGHRRGDGIEGSDARICVINVAEDPYTAKSSEYWADDRGVWHMGRRMTDEERAAVFGSLGDPGVR